MVIGGRELAASTGAQTDAPIEQSIRNHAGTVDHPVGNCRMGPGPLDVVDSTLRVHGLPGLRVVDASIMPRIVGGNTNAPAVMIAAMAAHTVRSDRGRSASITLSSPASTAGQAETLSDAQAF